MIRQCGALCHARPLDCFAPSVSDPFIWQIVANPRREHAEQEVNEQIIVDLYSR